jgi:hypothetical protein
MITASIRTQLITVLLFEEEEGMVDVAARCGGRSVFSSRDAVIIVLTITTTNDKRRAVNS